LDYSFPSGSFGEDFFDTMRKGGKEILDAAEKVVLAQGLRPTCVLMESIGGAAADLILEQAKERHADLIVMGTHGRRGIVRLALGSDAEQVVRAATVPVMLIRGQAAVKKAALKSVTATAA
jgi:nucleotide-binding universal stress UspA family protein